MPQARETAPKADAKEEVAKKAEAPKAEAVKEEAPKAEKPATEEKKAEETQEEVKEENKPSDELVKAFGDIETLQLEKEAVDGQLIEAQKRITELESEVRTKDQIIGDQQKTLTIHEKAIANLAPKGTPEAHTKGYNDVAQVAQKEEKLSKVKFLKAHEFTVGKETIKATKGLERELDIFVANKLSQRQIVTILN